MLTVDFDRLGLRAGERVLDMGCGAGRHAFEMYKRGADVIALDQDADELATVSEWFAAMREEGGLPAGAEADVKQGDALNLPFPDGDFDRVVAAEVLEHIPDDEAAIAELVRVLRPGGTIAVTVPRWLPEKVCWALSDAYHEVEGGHVRIYRGSELVARLEDAGLRLVGRDHVHGLHSPYWWLKCAVGVTNDDNPAVKAFHKLLVWDIVKRPLPTRLAEKVLDPLLGKSMVLYLEKPGARESVPPDSQIPAVAGILDASQVQATAVAIARVQQADGGIPWAVGEHIDVWNHVESAMALLVGGQREAAEAAYDWCLRGQRADGSWPMKIVGDTVVDASGETNMSSYLAVGVWHHWLLHRDLAFVRRTWPAVRGGLDFATGLQLPFGGIAWSQQDDGVVNTEALVAGSSSIYHALRAGLSIADLVGEPRPAWELAAGRLRHALESHLDLFLDKATFSMDWYYPVLGGPVRGQEARDRLDGRWDDFVVPGLGARCVDTNPWVTGAETCELALALDVVDDPRAVQVFADMQHLRHEDDMYWTGWVFGDDVNWPDEQTTYTSAAVILAADALSRTTSASGIFRGDGLAPHPAPLALHCDCAPDQVLTSG